MKKVFIISILIVSTVAVISFFAYQARKRNCAYNYASLHRYVAVMKLELNNFLHENQFKNKADLDLGVNQFVKEYLSKERGQLQFYVSYDDNQLQLRFLELHFLDILKYKINTDVNITLYRVSIELDEEKGFYTCSESSVMSEREIIVDHKMSKWSVNLD